MKKSLLHKFSDERALSDLPDADFIKAVKSVTSSIIMGNHELSSLNKTLAMLLFDVVKRMDNLVQAVDKSVEYKRKKMRFEVERDGDGRIVAIDTIEY